MAALLCALALGATITYSPGAAPLKVIVPAIASQTGLALEVAPEMEWHILFVRTQKAEPRELLEEIARACLGSWQKVGAKLRLVPNEANLAAAVRQEVQLLKAGLEYRYKELRSRGKADDLLAVSLYEAFGGDLLSLIPPGQTLTFSSQPTAMQRQLPNFENVFPHILESENKQRAYYEATFRNSNSARSEVDPNRFIPLRQLPESCIVKLWNEGWRIQGRLTFYDQSGAQALSRPLSLGGARAPDRPPMDVPKEPVALPLSPVHWLQEEDRKGRDGLRKAALNVGQSDPFLEAATAMCQAYIGPNPDNVVLALNEDMLRMPSDKIWIETIRASFDLTTVASRRPGWITRSFARLSLPVDRDRLREVLRRMSGSSPSIKDWAFWAASGSRLGRGALSSYFFSQAKTDLDRTNIQKNPFDGLLVAFGHLDEGRQDELLNGSTISFSKLPRLARQALERRFYGHQPLPSLELTEMETAHRKWMDGRLPPSEEEKVERSKVGIRLTSITSDATFSYPGGIPPDATFRVITFADSPGEYEFRFDTKKHGLRLNVRLRLD